MKGRNSEEVSGSQIKEEENTALIYTHIPKCRLKLYQVKLTEHQEEMDKATILFFSVTEKLCKNYNNQKIPYGKNIEIQKALRKFSK